MDDGAISHVPSDDEGPPVQSPIARALRPSFDAVESSPDSEGQPPHLHSYSSGGPCNKTQHGSTLLGPPDVTEFGRQSEHSPAPNRTWTELSDDVPPRKGPCKDSRKSRKEASTEFRERREKRLLVATGPNSLPMTLSIDPAICRPLVGRPSFNVVFRVGNPTRRFAYPIFAIHFNRIPANQRLTLGQATGPLTAALTARGASRATRRGCRMLRVDRELQVPQLTRDYGVWTRPALPGQVEGKRHWQTGRRLGPTASGEG